jgi:DNA-binding LacI/PurR family transcriptional regulator
MADVARLAGVSVSTVSYALTGARPISGQTRRRIEQAMLELDYTPNAFARGLKSKRSKIIALLLPKLDRAPGLSSLQHILGASDQARSRGYHLLLWTADADGLDDLAQLAGQGLAAGVLVLDVQLQDPRVDVLRDAGLTFAMIGRNGDSAGIDFTDTNFDHCARIAVDHLADQGHRRLGFVSSGVSVGDPGACNSIRLRDGIARAVREASVEVASVTCPSSIEGGRDALRELIRADPALTAVIAFNHEATPGIITEAVRTGRRVPEDLSILSIDMPAPTALMTTPTMTTVGPSAVRIGRAAAGLLIRRIEGDLVSATQLLLDGELQLRGSSGPYRAQLSRRAL